MELEAANQALFQALNAPADLSGLSLALATGAAKYSIAALVAVLAWNWLRSGARDRRALTLVVFAVPSALALNYLLGVMFPHPRPFMIGLGHTFLSHRPESSFPSDHATLMWTVALGMLLWSRWRWSAWLAVALAALTSWARIFLGLHFPFDILGSMAVAAVAVGSLVPLRPMIEHLSRIIGECLARIFIQIKHRLRHLLNAVY